MRQHMPLTLPLSPMLKRVGAHLHAAGAQAFVVGGAVRDMLLQRKPNDFDIEIYGLDATGLERALGTLGRVRPMGRSFSVWQVHGLDVDFSLPRADTFEEAVLHRDLTINAIGLDLHTGRIVDPLNGRADLEAGVLRACHPQYFGDDPLRALRVAQLMARFDMQPNEALTALCGSLELSAVAPERIFVELTKLLRQARRPSIGLHWLAQSGVLTAFKILHDMRGVPQSPKLHPEGDVWVHTCMVVDCAAALCCGDDDDVLMWAALLHDVGKPSTTSDATGKIRALNHDVEGVALAQAFLEKLKASQAMTRKVCTLVRHHLAPGALHRSNAADRSYRRLHRALDEGHVSMQQLCRLARADHLGRTTPAALRGEDAATDAFAERTKKLELAAQRPVDIVQGRHLLARGYKASPQFKAILEACRQTQDETGLTEAESILDLVLAQRGQ